MARLDDNELNIRPEVAAALGYNVPLANAVPSRRNGAVVLGRILSGLLGTAALFVAAVLVVAVLGWLYSFTLTPQPRQLGVSGAPSAATASTTHHHGNAKPSQQVSQRSVPVVDKQEQQSDATSVDAAESAAGVSDHAVQDPVQRDDVEPTQVIQYAVHVQDHETAPPRSDVEVNQENEIPEYLPADYDTGRVTAPLFLVREMPRGGAVDFLEYVPPGTCLLYERVNANGWRRVVSLDGRYAGYAQVYPTVAYQPRPIRPELMEAIAMIRRIQ
jgi:hypothetical protein